MSEKPPFWTDCFLILWVIVVGVTYFGGYFVPAIGALTGNFAAFYAGMVLVSAIVLARRFLQRSTGTARKPPDAKDEKR